MSCATECPGGKQGSVGPDSDHSRTTFAFGASLLVFLWFRLIDHLRMEWSSDEQYAYGWAVPFLCAYLCWHGARRAAPQTPTQTPTGGSTTPVLAGLALSMLALAYLPIRLLQEANPEWRLVSWALALMVIGVTFLLLPTLLDAVKNIAPLSQNARGMSLRPSLFAFPILFFLVSVPWPTILERPIIQTLARANTALAVETLVIFGVPTLQNGNMIEVGTGLVEIDAACSGIRSFQAALMISLFFGALNRLTPLRRFGLVLASFIIAFAFNVVRTTLLTWVAAGNGPRAIAAWHDPAGTAILVACFLSIWGLSTFFANSNSPGPSLSAVCEDRPSIDAAVASSSAWSRLSPVWVISIALWLAAAEFATFLWFRSVEGFDEKAIEWTVKWPESDPSFRVLSIDETTKRLLRFDLGMQAEWGDVHGKRWQVFHFVWNPGRTAGYLAKRHTPEVCLPGMGLELVRADPVATIDIGALCLPYRLFVFKSRSGALVNVLHSRWEHGMDVRKLSSESPTAYHLFRSIWDGRGRMGQQVLEMAVWGLDDPSKAESTFHEALRNLIAVDAQATPARSQLGTAPASYR